MKEVFVMSVVAVDIGGSKILCGKIVNGKVIKKIKLNNFDKKNKKNFVSDVIKVISSIDKKPKTICVGIPCILEKNICIEPENLKVIANMDFKKELEKAFNAKVFVEHDSECFTLGEYHYGKAKKYSNAVCITLGTGIGISVISEKKLIRGQYTSAGDIGKLPFNKTKTLEDMCSSKFFKKKGKSAKEYFELAKKGNKNAKKIFSEFGKNFSRVIAIVIDAYAPEVIVIGGGISKAKKYFEKEINSEIKKYCYKKLYKNTKILFSTNENSSLLGASMLPKLKK